MRRPVSAVAAGALIIGMVVTVSTGAGAAAVPVGSSAVTNFGSAHAYGAPDPGSLNRPVVGMAATPDGAGYWLVAADGGIFSYGDATFHGSTGAMVLNRPVVGMARTPDGGGYWMVASDGGIFSYGDATFYGSGVA